MCQSDDYDSERAGMMPILAFRARQGRLFNIAIYHSDSRISLHCNTLRREADVGRTGAHGRGLGW